MRDASESEQEEDFMPTTTAPNPKPTGPSKSEREATLRKMMDEESDEEMSDAASKDPTPEPALPILKIPTPEPTVVISGGRRRGRRKVMRKKTVKDEEGYISMCYPILSFLMPPLLYTTLHPSTSTQPPHPYT